jgi:DNA-binding beta-propeller fold protein YncE
VRDADGSTSAVIVWDVDTPAERLSFQPAGSAAAVAFNPDGRSLLVAELTSQRIGVYSAVDGREVAALATPGFQPEGADVDPTGTELAIRSQTSGAVQVRDLATGDLMRSIAVGDVFVVDWSPDGERLAIVSATRVRSGSSTWHSDRRSWSCVGTPPAPTM